MLDGVTVLDLSQVGPGPRCSWLLADLGADVVKVLPPAGSDRLEPPPHAYGAGRGTRAIRVDLKRGRDVFLALAASADVVVESYRPGVADRLGIGYDDCRAVNASIVYAAITGYGQDSPYATRAGHDLNYLAAGGYLAMQGRRADGGPAHPGATVADSAGGGMQAALAVCAALVRRSRTGDGAYLDVSTLDGVLYLTALAVDEQLATGSRSQLLSGRYACYDVYRCADGRWVSVAAIETRFFRNLCGLLGRPDVADAQYDDARQDEVRTALAERFATRGRDDWVAALADEDTCVAPVLDVDELAEDAHVATRVVETPMGFRQLGPLVAGSRPREHARGTEPDALLSAAGLDAADVERLKREGIVA